MEALDLRVLFDEKATLERQINYLVRSLDVSIDPYVQLCLYNMNSLYMYYGLISAPSALLTILTSL